MLTLLDPPAEHVLAMRITGRIDAEDIERATAAIDALMLRTQRVSFYTEMPEMQGISIDALIKDISYGIGMIGKLDRFMRMALVTDADWIATLTRFEAWFVPRVNVRTFSMSQKDEALAWVATPAEEVALVVPPSPALRPIETDSPAVIAFETAGVVTGADVETLAGRLDTAYRRGDRVNLLNRIAHFDGVDVASLAGSDLLRMKLDALRHIERYAIVGGPDMIRSIVDFVEPLARVEIRHFAAQNEPAAWHWVGAHPTSG